jgi:hypothetical protein
VLGIWTLEASDTQALGAIDGTNLYVPLIQRTGFTEK